MSAYYVIGCNQKIKNINKFNANFQEIRSIELKKLVKDVEFNQQFYYVSDFLTLPLNFENKENNNINFDTATKDKTAFIEFLKTETYLYNPVEFYKFWSLFDNAKDNDDINQIFDTEKINILEDKFNPEIDFDFHIKYIF